MTNLQIKGKVILVGAGPGDEGLLTLKGKSWIERADVIIYDHLVNVKMARFGKPGVEMIYAGKTAGKNTLNQEEINHLLIRKARLHKIGVRLKGGDPFIFGRGGEEAQALKTAGVPFEVVPGVTSPVGVSAYAGIPLTHRDFASTVSIITGTAGKGHEPPIDWPGLAQWPGTLVFLMGARKLKQITESLIRHGKDPATPIAVIQWGSTPHQKTWTGNLQTIQEIVGPEIAQPPALTIVGKVVNLKKNIDWFETLPLFGKTVVVTRPENQADSVLHLLEEKGAVPYSLPVIDTVPPDDWSPLDQSLKNLGHYFGLIFTSLNGVRFFMERLRHQEKDIRELKGVRVYAIGPKTATALEGFGIRADVVPDEYVAESLLQSLGRETVAGKRFLLPRATVAREALPEELSARGAEIDVVPAYQTVPKNKVNEEFLGKLREGAINAITFTASSTVTHFLSWIEDKRLLKNVTIACIGPITARTLEDHGFKVDVIAKEYTVEGLVEALEVFYKSH